MSSYKCWANNVGEFIFDQLLEPISSLSVNALNYLSRVSTSYIAVWALLVTILQSVDVASFL